MAINKRVSVALTEEEYSFIQWLRDRDGVTEQRELQQIFYTELSALMDLYLEEMKQEQHTHNSIHTD